MPYNFSFSGGKKEKKGNQKTTVEAGEGNCFKFLNYLMEQKCFLRLFREREGQMSLINADLLRGLGSGRGRQSSCLSQCTRNAVWDPGWEVRAGPLSTRSGWWVYRQKVQRGAGCCAPTLGCLHPRADLTCTNTAERQGRALSALSSTLEIWWLSEEKSRS